MLSTQEAEVYGLYHPAQGPLISTGVQPKKVGREGSGVCVHPEASTLPALSEILIGIVVTEADSHSPHA